jgi:hypothetical protein
MSLLEVESNYVYTPGTTQTEVIASMPGQPSASRGGEGKIAITATYYAGLLTLGLAVAVIGPSLPRLAAHTGSTLSRISYLFTAYSLGYLLGSLISGRLFDRT